MQDDVQVYWKRCQSLQELTVPCNVSLLENSKKVSDDMASGGLEDDENMIDKPKILEQSQTNCVDFFKMVNANY